MGDDVRWRFGTAPSRSEMLGDLRQHANLRDLPAHVLKLDKSFVEGMRTRRGDRVIVESTVRMAHALDLCVVAEGVESEADARLLAELSCDFAQGYHYSPPLPANACAEWIRNVNDAVARSQRADPPAATSLATG